VSVAVAQAATALNHVFYVTNQDGDYPTWWMIKRPDPEIL
jgi:hypothetical protein